MPKSAQFTVTTSAQIVVPEEIGDQMAYLHSASGALYAMTSSGTATLFVLRQIN
jgi:hypothetical protein